MITPSRNTMAAAAVIVLAAGFSIPAHAAPPTDWSKIPTKTVTLFYPGQSTYQWLRTREHEDRAAEKVSDGESCTSCHKGEEAKIGDLTVTGKILEPTPIPGKNGSLKLTTQAAHDGEYLYLRFQWKSNMNREGRMHNMMRFDGKGWKFYGNHRVKEAVASGKEPPIYEDRLAIMIDDGSVPDFAKHGCWVTCHDSMRHMPNAPTSDQVKAHPLLGKKMKKKDIRKYLATTRTDENASWDKTKSPEEIAKIKASGGFLDLMQWRVHRSNPVGMADDGYVLEYRIFDKGKKMFSWNVDKKTMTPKYMFDESKVGFKALREEDFTDPAKPTAIVKEANGVPYDANAGFEPGDILPGRLLTARTEGSAGDNDSAKGTWKDGVYTLVFRRKLDTGHPEDDKIMKVGGKYTIGIAVHDDNVTTRFHQVSFPLTLGIGVKADIEAIALN